MLIKIYADSQKNLLNQGSGFSDQTATYKKKMNWYFYHSFRVLILVFD